MYVGRKVRYVAVEWKERHSAELACLKGSNSLEQMSQLTESRY